MIRLAIVDDHAIVRAGFREMLNEELGMSIQFEAGTAEEAQNLLRQHNCDVLMLDLSLPDQNGIDLLRAVKQRHEETQVLIISSFSEERYALSMIRSGASGYLCKDCDRSDLINAIQVELLRRVRDEAYDDEVEMKNVVLLGVNALAAAMQSTG